LVAGLYRSRAVASTSAVLRNDSPIRPTRGERIWMDDPDSWTGEISEIVDPLGVSFPNEDDERGTVENPGMRQSKPSLVV